MLEIPNQYKKTELLFYIFSLTIVNFCFKMYMKQILYKLQTITCINSYSAEPCIFLYIPSSSWTTTLKVLLLLFLFLHSRNLNIQSKLIYKLYTNLSCDFCLCQILKLKKGKLQVRDLQFYRKVHEFYMNAFLLFFVASVLIWFGES